MPASENPLFTGSAAEMGWTDEQIDSTEIANGIDLTHLREKLTGRPVIELTLWGRRYWAVPRLTGGYLTRPKVAVAEDGTRDPEEGRAIRYWVNQAARRAVA